MKRILLVLLVGLSLAGCKNDKPSASRETSPGGIVYNRIYLPQAKDVAIRIAWPTDWATRGDVNQAVPYIGKDLILSGGAEGYPAGKAVEMFADLNADAGIAPSVDNIRAGFVVPKENLDAAITIANAHLRAPALDPEWLVRIRDGFAARMAETMAKPDQQGFAALRWAAFGNSPVREALSLDKPGMVEAVTRDEVSTWHAQVFTRRGATIVIAGALSDTEAGKAVDALLGGLPEGGPVDPPAIQADFTPRRILLLQPDAEASSLTFIGPLPPTAEGHEFDDIILVKALGVGEGSVLFNAVRTDLRAAYGFSAGLGAFSRANRFLVLRGQVETSKMAQVEEAVLKAYTTFRETGPEGPVSNLKAPFAANIQKTAGQPASVSFSALMGVLDGREAEQALALDKLLDDVSQDSLLARLQQAFPAPDQFTILAVSPDANALPGACVITEPEQAKACR